MNKDDAELFGMLKKSTTTDCILLMDRSKSPSYIVAYDHMKRYGNLSSVKTCRLFEIEKCPKYVIVYGSSKKEVFPTDGCGNPVVNNSIDYVKLSMVRVKELLSDFVNIQHKNMKVWNTSIIEGMTFDGLTYQYCKHLKNEIIPVYRFLHATHGGRTKANSLMTQLNNSKAMVKTFPAAQDSSAPAPKLVVPKAWSSYASYLDRLLFLKNACLIYQTECYNDNWNKHTIANTPYK